MTTHYYDAGRRCSFRWLPRARAGVPFGRQGFDRRVVEGLRAVGRAGRRAKSRCGKEKGRVFECDNATRTWLPVNKQ